MSADIHLDHKGIREVLNAAETKLAVHDLAVQIAAAVQAEAIPVSHGDYEIPVVVDDYITDRVASSVTLAHPAGLAVQAKYGVLTRAAGALGLEVREKGSR